MEEESKDNNRLTRSLVVFVKEYIKGMEDYDKQVFFAFCSWGGFV